MGQYALDLVFNAAAALALIALPILILSWARYMKAVNRAWSPASRAAAALPVSSKYFGVLTDKRTNASSYLTRLIARPAFRKALAQ